MHPHRPHRPNTRTFMLLCFSRPCWCGTSRADWISKQAAEASHVRCCNQSKERKGEIDESMLVRTTHCPFGPDGTFPKDLFVFTNQNSLPRMSLGYVNIDRKKAFWKEFRGDPDHGASEPFRAARCPAGPSARRRPAVRNNRRCCNFHGRHVRLGADQVRHQQPVGHCDSLPVRVSTAWKSFFR